MKDCVVSEGIEISPTSTQQTERIGLSQRRRDSTREFASEPTIAERQRKIKQMEDVV